MEAILCNPSCPNFPNKTKAPQMGRDSLKNRWAVLVACIWLDCCTGASYGFSIYSETIKNRFGYTQQQLDTISVFAGLGGIGGILSGLLYQCFPPWIVLFLGALHNLVGYAVLWLYVTGRLASPALWELCLATCIAMNSELYYSTASMVTCVTNFPANRGIVVGLKKGCLGLSSAILSTLWKVFFRRSDGSSFLLVGGIVPSAVALLIMPIVRKYEVDDCGNGPSRTMKNLATVSAPLVLLAVFLMGSAFWDGHTLQANRVEFAIMLVILATPLYVAWKASIDEKTSIKNSKLLEPFINQGDSNISDRYAITEYANSSLCRVIFSIDFFLAFFTSAVAIASSLVAINNMNQVATALGYGQQDITIFVTLVSVAQFLGRFGSGVLSDYFLFKFGVGRPLLTALAGFILCCGHLFMVLAGTFPQALYVGCIFIGFSFGANWCLNSITVSDLFGLGHFGALYNVVMMGNPIVSYVLSVWVAGYLYDIEVVKQGGEHCKGNTCFDLTFIILASICVLASLASSILWWRTKHIYRKRMSN